jgi:hypothetical protein
MSHVFLGRTKAKDVSTSLDMTGVEIRVRFKPYHSIIVLAQVSPPPNTIIKT